MAGKLAGLDRGRTVGYYMTLRHKAQIEALAAYYTGRERKRVSASQVLQILVERDVKRLKIPPPVAPHIEPVAENERL